MSDAQLYLISSVTTLMLVAAVTGLIALSRQVDDVLLDQARIKQHLGLIDRPTRRRTLTNWVRRALHQWRATRTGKAAREGRQEGAAEAPQRPQERLEPPPATTETPGNGTEALRGSEPHPPTTGIPTRPPVPAPPTAPIRLATDGSNADSFLDPGFPEDDETPAQARARQREADIQAWQAEQARRRGENR
jgi:hypothetical protein